jgi:hypothetical protein
MAISAFTLADSPSGGSTSNVFHDRVTFAGDDAYPTGGTAAFAALIKAQTGDNRTPIIIIAGLCGAFLPQYDVANDKLVVRQLSDGAEVANTTDLSGTTFNLVVVSK